MEKRTMRISWLTGCAAVLLTFSGTAMAQQTTPPTLQTPGAQDAPAAPAETAPTKPSETAPASPPGQDAAPGGRPPSAAKVSKRRACRDEARRQGLRGDAASGHILICMAEARLECTKQAVAQATDRRGRNTMIRECLGQGERRRPGGR
jgi:hypothetical protein